MKILKKIMLLIIYIFSFLTRICLSDLSCKDQNGVSVDWFTLYKMPTISTQTNSLAKIGQAYAYITNITQAYNWTLSTIAINALPSLHGKTLNPIYNSDTNLNKTQLGYIMYNDGLTSSSSYAHAKGVVIFDNTSIVWIIHSFPDYPMPRSSNTSIINASQLVYGQSMMCLSLNLADLGKVVNQLLVIYPFVYDSFIPTSLNKNAFVLPTTNT